LTMNDQEMEINAPRQRRAVTFGDVHVREVDRAGNPTGTEDQKFSIGVWEQFRGQRGLVEPNNKIDPSTVSRLLSQTSCPQQLLPGIPTPIQSSTLIDNWHIKSDGCVWQGPKEHSSPLHHIDGRFFQTRSSSW